MSNKRIMISESERKLILDMHKSYEKKNIVTESTTQDFPPCVTKRNKLISSVSSPVGSTYIIIDGNHYSPDGRVALNGNKEEIYPYECKGDEIIIHRDQHIELETEDDRQGKCILNKSQNSVKAFQALDKACQHYITSQGYEGFAVNFNFSGFLTWPDEEIQDAIIGYVRTRQDLIDLRELIKCYTQDEVTLDGLLLKGMSTWDAEFKRVKNYIKKLESQTTEVVPPKGVGFVEPNIFANQKAQRKRRNQ